MSRPLLTRCGLNDFKLAIDRVVRSDANVAGRINSHSFKPARDKQNGEAESVPTSLPLIDGCDRTNVVVTLSVDRIPPPTTCSLSPGVVVLMPTNALVSTTARSTVPAAPSRPSAES